MIFHVQTQGKKRLEQIFVHFLIWIIRNGNLSTENVLFCLPSSKIMINPNVFPLSNIKQLDWLGFWQFHTYTNTNSDLMRLLKLIDIKLQIDDPTQQSSCENAK